MRGHIYQMQYKSILRKKVRPERLNRVVFLATNDRLFFVTRSEGGCDKIRDEGVTKSYSHISLILLLLSPIDRPLLCRARKKEGDDSDPPKKRGVMRPRVGVQCGTPTRGSQGVAIVGIYPCGKARKPDKSERWECRLSLLPHDPGSVLAVKGSASPRSAPWTAPGRSGRLLFTREKGGLGRACRAERKPFGHTSALSRSGGAESPAGP